MIALGSSRLEHSRTLTGWTCGLSARGPAKTDLSRCLGAGRFARIGIPFPDVMGPFVGVVETVCGALIILGLFTRLAAIPLINYHDRGSHLDQAPDLALGTIYGFSILLRTSSARVCGA